MFSPFLIAVHTARRGDVFTDDFFRFSASSLRRLLTDTGFRGPIEIEACSFAPFTAAANLFLPGMRVVLLKTAFVACSLQLVGQPAAQVASGKRRGFTQRLGHRLLCGGRQVALCLTI